MQHNKPLFLLCLTIVFLSISGLPASANAGWWFIFMGTAFIAVAAATLCIDAVVAKFFFAVSWLTAFLSVAVANAVSFSLGTVGGMILLENAQQMPVFHLPFFEVGLHGVELAAVVAGLLVVLGALVETAVLTLFFWFLGAEQAKRFGYVAVFAVNAVLSGVTAYSAFVPETYDAVTLDEVELLQQVYAEEIAFMHETAAGLSQVWADEDVALVDGRFIYPKFNVWQLEREAKMAGLDFVSLELIGYPLNYPHNRRATLGGPRMDLMNPRVTPWQDEGIRVERAAGRYIYDVWMQPAVFGPAEKVTTYSYTITSGKFELIALFEVPTGNSD